MKEKTFVVITGASSGIGYEAAKAFAGRGENVIVIARREEKILQLQSEGKERFPGVEIVIKTADLAVTENVYRVYEALREYPLKAWINNAGMGDYGSVGDRAFCKIERLLRLNVEALTLFSSLFVRDYKNAEGAQLINVSSCGGYVLVPNAIPYCASKFYVSAFTEGLARELRESDAKLRAKVFAPAAVKTEFGRKANDVETYDYDARFKKYHTAGQAAGFLLALYDSDQTVGFVDRETFQFRLLEPQFPYAGSSAYNQK